jgi:hypothetical protein
MEERERSARLSPEIYVYATKKNFLNLYDALRIEKVKFEVSGYDPDTNRQTGVAVAWLDLDDARLLTHLVAHRLFVSVTGGRWEKFGGSQRDDGSIESRTVTVEWDEGENARFARNPYRITIANGPGRKTATGGVSPDGQARALLSMRLPESDMIKVMLALGDYIHAYESAHHHRIVADRVRELRDKLAERAERNGNGASDRAYVQPTAHNERPAAEQPARTQAPSGPPALQSIPGGAGRTPRPAASQTAERDRSRLTPLRAEKAV